MKPEEARLALLEIVTNLSGQVLELSLLQARARLDAIELPLVDHRARASGGGIEHDRLSLGQQLGQRRACDLRPGDDKRGRGGRHTSPVVGNHHRVVAGVASDECVR